MSSGVGRKFHFIREIASGGFGSVFLAKIIHDDGFSRLAAIKLLHAKWSEDEEIASRMRDEARLLGWLRHRNIVDVLDLTVIDGRVAVVMEYLEAVDCKIVIQARRKAGGAPVPYRVAFSVGAAVASALDAAYNRPPYAGEKPLHVIHRDIKPSNIMIDESGTPKVLDFGVARADFDARESHTQELSFGSMDYMPPERLFFEPDKPASDVYSLGATLFEMLALEKFGKARLRPKEHEDFIFDRLEVLLRKNPIEDPDLGEDAALFLKSMLSFDENDRPTAAECVTKLRALARRFKHEDALGEWAEQVIPPLVQDTIARQAAGKPDPLVDKVLSEDSRGFPRGAGPVPPGQAAGPTATEPTPPEDDARWTALKESTLAEIQGQAGADDEVTDVGERAPTAEVERGPGAVAGEPPPPVARAPRPVADARPPKPRPSAPVASLPEASVEEGGGIGKIVAAVVAVAGIGMLGLGLVAVLAVVGVSMSGDAEPTRSASVAPTVEPVPTEEPPVDAAPEGPAAKFVSALPDTKKIMVRCEHGDGEGADAAFVEGETFGRCTVTAIDARRKRRTAVLTDVEPREYTCFRGDGSDCE